MAGQISVRPVNGMITDSDPVALNMVEVHSIDNLEILRDTRELNS
ncbi:MAG: hypothetical protein ACRD63_10290 [Pyrinomonadaceae bacterium]|jgi:hypothetical protein